MSDKILVSFTNEQHNILESLHGIMGNSHAEVVRTIVMSWLSEQGYLKEYTINEKRQIK